MYTLHMQLIVTNCQFYTPG